MEIIFSTAKIEKICTDFKAARRFFGGEERLARGLLARVNSLEQAPTMKDIVVQKHLRFHALSKKGRRDLRGMFAVDITNSRNPWRLIVQPLNKGKEPFDPCHIDEIAEIVEVVGIIEVSNHYE